MSIDVIFDILTFFFVSLYDNGWLFRIFVKTKLQSVERERLINSRLHSCNLLLLYSTKDFI